MNLVDSLAPNDMKRGESQDLDEIYGGTSIEDRGFEGGASRSSTSATGVLTPPSSPWIVISLLTSGGITDKKFPISAFGYTSCP